ncbi:MAG: HAMP domain-containing histidine kinase [Spirochaetales bacterium]|nr:HAMP domain-containing histidine kinase [Spirochaetales bacterium]
MFLFFIYSVPQAQSQIRKMENPLLETALEESLTILSQRDKSSDEKIELLSSEVLVINREYNKRILLQEDFLVIASQNLLYYLLLQFILLFITLFFLVRTMLGHLKQMMKEISTLEKNQANFRFSVPKGYEFRKLALNLNQLLQTIEEREAFIKEQAKFVGWKEVSSFLTHQFKNPLSSIMVANKNIMLQAESSTEVISESTEIILNEVQRLSDLVNRLKGLCDFPDLILTRVNIFTWLKEIISDYKRMAIQIQGEEALELYIDKQLFHEVFGNLINNSLDAGAKNMQISLESDENCNKMIISDDVKGLNPEVLDKIFLPKFSTKKQGSGLGLIFVKRVVHLHKAKLVTRLSPHGGLVFSFIWKKEESL